jgi:competence protein ComEC
MEFSSLDQHGYLLSSFIRKTFALNLSVFLATFLPLLYLFHKFPLLSLAYNLFFPLGVSLSLLLLLSASLFSFIPSFSAIFHQINNAFTSALLELISYPPAILDFYVRTPCVTFEIVIVFLSIFFFFGVHFFRKKERTT